MNTGNCNVDKKIENLLQNCGIELKEGTKLTVSGSDPVMNTPWKIGEAAAAALGAMGIAVDDLWGLRKGTNSNQNIELDVASAALSTLRCMYMKQNGYSVPFPDIDYPTVGIYKTKDNRHVFINGGFPGLRRGILKTLNCPDDREALAAALMKWNAEDIERELQSKGFCCAVCRTSEEWKKHEHGSALYQKHESNDVINPVIIEKICDSEPQPFTMNDSADRPLSGLKVLDLTHVLAGPTCGMILAEQDADVMRINGPQIPFILPFVMDTGHGKMNVQLDLKTKQGRDALWNLIDTGADVFSESYRPNTFEKIGFSPKAIAERVKGKGRGIIYVSINCYGYNGPWKDYPGWEQLAQATTGLACEQGGDGEPTLLPTFPNDYMTGYLAAYGVLVALKRRHLEGGSYHVKVSLCATAMWLQSFGKIGSVKLPPVEIAQDVVEKNILQNSKTGYGDLQYFGHPVKFSATPANWKRPAVPIGFNKPEWE